MEVVEGEKAFTQRTLAVATIVAATAAASTSKKDKQMDKTDMVVASAATLSHGDILTLIAAAATALRGATTLKARALKEVWNIAAVIPVDRGVKVNKNNRKSNSYHEDILPEENFLRMCNQELLAQGSELRTCNGDLHWKIVSVYIHWTGEVMLKMKSKHVGSTIMKKKKRFLTARSFEPDGNGILRDAPITSFGNGAHLTFKPPSESSEMTLDKQSARPLTYDIF
nr:VAN3-binding protein-like [Tanacetum cinerariifolium]